MGYFSKRRPSTAPGILVSSTNNNNGSSSRTSSLFPPPPASSNDPSSGGGSSTMGFMDFLASAPPPSHGEQKRSLGSEGKRRESSSRPSSASTTSSSLSTPRSSTFSAASSSKVRFSFPRSMSTSSSLSTTESDRPLTPTGAIETFGFIRLQTLSGGICFIADVEGEGRGKKEKETDEAAVELLEDVGVEDERFVKAEEVAEIKPFERSPSIISRSSASSKNWTPPSKPAPETPTSTFSRRANSNVLPPTRLSILITPPPPSTPTPSNLVIATSLRNLPNPPSAWKSLSPPPPKASSFIKRGGRRIAKVAQGGNSIEAAIALLAASQEHGYVLKRLGLDGVEAIAEDWVVVVGEEEKAFVETAREEGKVGGGGGRGWFGGKKVKVKGKGKKVAKKSSGEILSFLGREFGARAPFYVV
ncbi:hypothetical protein BDY24DRAFT_416597 [Mrakia frigida]|uniref:uncharacterized protein n=1 Tax=Mrakia frigida TaxID=29902 RepID=UPI003FCC0117